MPTRRAWWWGVGVVVATGAIAVGAVATTGRSDPTEQVEGIALGDLQVSLPTGPLSELQRSGQQVAALDSVEGVLQRRGDDPDDLVIGSIAMEFGPEEWVITAGPIDDYDGDGTAEDLLGELDGLVGQHVTALVRLDNDGDDAEVYVLNGKTYRDTAGGPAPWLEALDPTSDAATPQEVTEAAARAVGVGSMVDELDRKIAGEVAWEAEVIAVDGQAYEVLLDLGGDVLDVRRDD